MKKLLLLALVSSAIVAGINISTHASVIEKEEGYISVNAASNQEIAPNQVEITINVETSDISLQKASDDNKVIANKVYLSLKSLLGANDYLKTQNYSANPVYVYTKENKRVLDKYTVSNNVVVRTKNIALVPKLIDSAISKGATNVNNLQFSTTDYDDACNELLAGLTKKAHTQVESVARAINAKIIGAKSINLTCNPENNQRPYMYMAKNAMDGASSTPIESGKIKIYANVDASFYVK